MLASHIEVDDKDLVVTLPDKQVGRFDISVYYLLFVKVHQTIQNLNEKLTRLILTVYCLLHVKHVQEFYAIYELHHLVLLVAHFVVEVIVDLDNVFMLQLSEDVILLLLC